MIRVDRRGSQEFEEVSWDAALNVVAENFLKIKEEHGPEAVALFSHGYGGGWMKHLFHAWGSPNITAPSYAQCRGPRDVGFDLTFGSGVGSPERTDLRNSKCIVLIGSHLGENMHNTQVQDFAHALRNDADLIVLDPRFSVAASKATHWLPVKPGTDMAILLAWMNVLINENLYDRDYVERYAYGFDQLREHVQPYTPEWAYPRSGIEPDVIRHTARMMGGAKPATLVHPGRHVTWYGNDTQRSRAIAVVNALLGSWGRQGGFYVPSAVSIPPYEYPAYDDEGHSPADKPAPSLYPLADDVLAQGICDATVPGGLRGDPSIKAWMVYGSNLPTTLPNPEQTYKAIQALDFLVTVDVLPAEIVGWSDVVLPEATYLERCDEPFAPAYRESYVTVRQEVVPPMYDSKPGWWIAREMGIRLGLPHFFPWETPEEYAESRLKPLGIDCEIMKKEGVVLGPKKPIYFEEGRRPRVLDGLREDRALLAEAGGAGLRRHAHLERGRRGGATSRVLSPSVRPGAHAHLRAHHQQPTSLRDPRRERGVGEHGGGEGLGTRARRPDPPEEPGRRHVHLLCPREGDRGHSPRLRLHRPRLRPQGGQAAPGVRQGHRRRRAHHPLQGGPHHGRHRDERELRHVRPAGRW